MTEFEIIQHYFATQTQHRADVLCGIGDDGAIVNVPKAHELVMTTDTLVAGVHFPEATSPHDIGYKSLAVNLSDLAAMGATPTWVMLALTLPDANDTWLQAFCTDFFALANHYDVQLIGGDLTRGSLSITVQAMGMVPSQQAIKRSGAKPADLIYVTGTIGDAGLALGYLQKKITLSPSHQAFVLERLNRPEPRVPIGEHLRGLAHAAIDISDGLAADLGHMLEASGVGARVDVDQLPLSEALQTSLSQDKAIALALTAGDDYELCFTIPPEKKSVLEKKLSLLSCPYRCIGMITEDRGLVLHDSHGNRYHGSILGYHHF